MANKPKAKESCCSECGGILYETAKAVDKTVCNSDGVAARLLQDMANLGHEEFRVIALDTRLQVIGVKTVAIGGLAECSVDVRKVFAYLLEVGACKTIVAHNHPSGDSSPSGEDNDITARLVACGELMGLQVIDHVIIGKGVHYSYTASGRLGKA